MPIPPSVKPRNDARPHGVNLLPYDNLRAVNTRTDSAESLPSAAMRGLLWLIVALVIVGGVIAAIWLSPRITPLMDTIR
jgi:hypothetical protein